MSPEMFIALMGILIGLIPLIFLIASIILLFLEIKRKSGARKEILTVVNIILSVCALIIFLNIFYSFR